MENKNILCLIPENFEKCANIWDMNRQKDLAELFYTQLCSGIRHIFVCEECGQYVGEIALVLQSEDPEYTIPGRRAYLSHLIVKRELRGRGIGSALINFCVQYARELGFCELSLGVDAENESARHFYAKRGFNTVLSEGEDEHGFYFKLLKIL